MAENTAENTAEKPKQSDDFYKIQDGQGYKSLKFNGALNPEQVKAFEENAFPLLFVQPFTHLIVNCDNLSTVSKPWLRIFIGMQNEAKKVNKEVRLILVSQSLKTFFKNEGVDGTFKYSMNLRDAQVELKLVAKKALDVDFINPFLSATMHVLKVQAQTGSKPGKLFIKKDSDKMSGDISGIIGIVSESFKGSVVISFPEQTFLKIMSKMLGENYTQLTKEITDGAGELTNIIFGQAKIVLNEKGYGIKTALPSVVTGKDHSVQNLSKGPVVTVPFDSDAGAFYIEICLSD